MTSPDWWAGTDDRNEVGQRGSSRHKTVGSIARSAIGHFEDLTGDLFTSAPSESYRVQTTTTYQVNAFRNTLQQDAADDSYHTESRHDGPTGKSLVEFETGSSYPFRNGPQINYDLAFTFERLSNGETMVRVFGWHDAFPAYEIIINGTVVGQYYPTDPGPTILNLGGVYTVTVVAEFLVLPPDRR